MPGLSQSVKSGVGAKECESEDDTDLKDILAQRARRPRQSRNEVPAEVPPTAIRPVASTSTTGTRQSRNEVPAEVPPTAIRPVASTSTAGTRQSRNEVLAEVPSAAIRPVASTSTAGTTNRNNVGDRGGSGLRSAIWDTEDYRNHTQGHGGNMQDRYNRPLNSNPDTAGQNNTDYRTASGFLNRIFPPSSESSSGHGLSLHEDVMDLDLDRSQVSRRSSASGSYI